MATNAGDEDAQLLLLLAGSAPVAASGGPGAPGSPQTPSGRPILQPSMRQLKQQSEQAGRHGQRFPSLSDQESLARESLVQMAGATPGSGPLTPPRMARPGPIPVRRESFSRGGNATTPSMPETFDYNGGSPARSWVRTPGSPGDATSPSSAASSHNADSPQRHRTFGRENSGYFADATPGEIFARGRARVPRNLKEQGVGAYASSIGEDDDRYIGSPSAASSDEFRSNRTPSVTADFAEMDLDVVHDSGDEYRQRGQRRDSMSSDGGSSIGPPPLPRHDYPRTARVPAKVSRSSSTTSAAGRRGEYRLPGPIRSHSTQGFPRSSLHVPEIVVSSPRSPRSSGLSMHPPISAALESNLPSSRTATSFKPSIVSSRRRNQSPMRQTRSQSMEPWGSSRTGRTGRSSTPGPYPRDGMRSTRANRSPSRSRSPEAAADALYRRKRILARKRIPGDNFDPTAGIELGGFELANYQFFNMAKAACVPDLDADAARRLQEYRDSIRKLEQVGGPSPETAPLNHQFRDFASLVTSSGRAEVRRRDEIPSLTKSVSGSSMGELDTVFVADPLLDLEIRRQRRAVWSQADKDLFERGLAKHGRNFWLISLEFGNQLTGKKSFHDCVEYYYLNKFHLKWLKRHNYEKKVNREFNEFREDVLSTSTTVNKMIAKLKYEKARTAEERRRATSQPPASRYPGRMGTPVADFDRFKPSPLGVFVDQDDSSAPSVLESELSSVTPPPPPLSLAGVIPTDNGIVPILEVPVEDVEMADDDDRGRGSSLEPGEWFPGGSKASSGDDSGLYAHGEEDSTEGKPSFGDTSTTNASSPEALPAFVDSDIPRT